MSNNTCRFYCSVFLPCNWGWKTPARLFARQDMSAGDVANSCSGRLSIGNLQGHMPWVFFWVQWRASSRLIAWCKRTTSVIVVKYFRAAPVGVHVYLDGTPVSTVFQAYDQRIIYMICVVCLCVSRPCMYTKMWLENAGMIFKRLPLQHSERGEYFHTNPPARVGDLIFNTNPQW